MCKISWKETEKTDLQIIEMITWNLLTWKYIMNMFQRRWPEFVHIKQKTRRHFFMALKDMFDFQMIKKTITYSRFVVKNKWLIFICCLILLMPSFILAGLIDNVLQFSKLTTWWRCCVVYEVMLNTELVSSYFCMNNMKHQIFLLSYLKRSQLNSWTTRSRSEEMLETFK